VDKYTVSCSAVLGQVLCRGSTRAGYEAMDPSRMMAKHKYRSWYMKIHAIISTHGFGYIMDHLYETNYCLFLSEFGQRCEDCFVQDWHASLEMTCIGNMVTEINSEHTGDLSTVLNGSLT